ADDGAALEEQGHHTRGTARPRIDADVGRRAHGRREKAHELAAQWPAEEHRRAIADEDEIPPRRRAGLVEDSKRWTANAPQRRNEARRNAVGGGVHMHLRRA